MGSFKKECSDILRMKCKDALRLKEEIEMHRKIQRADEDLTNMAARMRAKEASKQIRKMLFS